MAPSDDDILAQLDDFPALPDHDLFDASGLPMFGSEAFDQMLLCVEEGIDADGWDQPSKLMALATPQFTATLIGDQINDLPPMQAAGPAHDGGPLVQFRQAVVPLAETTGIPAVEMLGYTAPAWACAVLLSFEGWALVGNAGPDGEPQEVPNPLGLRPSEHPDRKEFRSVLLVTRDGRTRSVVRERGKEPRIEADQGKHQGILVDVVRRTLGAPVAGQGHTLAGFLRQSVLTLLASYLTETLGGELKPGAAGEHADGMEQLRAKLAQLPPEQRQSAHAALLASQVLPAIALTTYRATNKGKRGIDRSMGKVLAQIATRKRTEYSDADVAAVCACAQSAARTLTWEDLSSTGPILPMLGEIAGKVRWAGPDLFATWVCGRFLPDSEDTLAVLERVAGTEARSAVDAMLDIVGWVDPQGSA